MNLIDEEIQERKSLYIAIACKYTSGRAQAEDVVAEAFRRVLVKRSTLTPEKLSGYIVVTMKHIWIDIVKSASHKRNHSLDKRSYYEDGFQACKLVSPDRDPLKILVCQENSSRVRQAVESLRIKLSDVVRAVDLDGCSYKDVAVNLGVTLGTVRSRLHRGRKLLEISLTRMGFCEAKRLRNEQGGN